MMDPVGSSLNAQHSRNHSFGGQDGYIFYSGCIVQETFYSLDKARMHSNNDSEQKLKKLLIMKAGSPLICHSKATI